MKLTTLKKELENSNLIFFQKLFPLYQNSETELTHFLKRLKKLVSKFEQSFQEQEINIIRAPGRVNLIGEHTDYNGYPVTAHGCNPGYSCVGCGKRFKGSFRTKHQ